MKTALRDRAPPRDRLAANVAIALALLATASQVAASGPALPPRVSAPTPARQPAPMSHVVTSCSDDFVPGTLRWVLADPNTHSGDVIDLTQLMCSRITLGSELRVHQDDLTMLGPQVAYGYFTLDAQRQSEAIQHFGYGTLELSDVDVQNGYYQSATDPTGGCIWSRGSISLKHSHVTRCGVLALSSAHPALGGAIYVRGHLTLSNSTIGDSRAYSNVGGAAAGGGAFVMGSLTAKDSSIRNNAARTLNGGVGQGGGAFVRGGALLETTTIAGNRADNGGGLVLYDGVPNATATISSSTVSGNKALGSFGGIYSKIPLTLNNSTIAFNASIGPASGGDGVFLRAPLVMNSTIIADNAGRDGLADLDGSIGVTISGANNLVVHAGPHVSAPIDTLATCPKLDALLNSGGATATHGIRHGSAAIDAGDDHGLLTDQRGMPRITGSGAEIGSFERQSTDVEERLLSSGFEGPCDI